MNAAAGERLAVDRVQARPRQVGVARLVGTASGVGRLTAARRHRLFDRHERRRQIGPARVELQAAVPDDGLALEHEAGFHLGRVVQRDGGREELAHELVSSHEGPATIPVRQSARKGWHREGEIPVPRLARARRDAQND